jgi:hypothetical protein
VIRTTILGLALLSAAAAMARNDERAPPDDAVISGASLPPTLAEYGFFANAPAQLPAARVTAYRLNTPLWSDGAD